MHDVGDFIASFAPSPADLDRLDERFRITPELFAARPAYRDWGFAVFQLKPREAEIELGCTNVPSAELLEAIGWDLGALVTRAMA